MYQKYGYDSGLYLAFMDLIVKALCSLNMYMCKSSLVHLKSQVLLKRFLVHTQKSENLTNMLLRCQSDLFKTIDKHFRSARSTDQHLFYFSTSTLLNIPLNRHSLGSFNFFFYHSVDVERIFFWPLKQMKVAQRPAALGIVQYFVRIYKSEQRSDQS